MDEETADKLAHAITDYLFRNGLGEEATHLKLYTDMNCLGGWSKSAATDRVRRILLGKSKTSQEHP